MTVRERLFRIADRLGQAPAGSAVADETIHQALGRAGPAPPYTTDIAAARTLLPSGFVELGPLFNVGAVYGSRRRAGVGSDGLPFPHHGGWGATLPLALCHAAVRAQAALLPKP